MFHENEFKAIEEKLADPQKEQILVFQPQKKKIIIGAPHHAPAGVKKLRCNRVSDQNTGYIALELANELESTAVISTNASVDPNKKFSTSYAKTLLEMSPNYLIEIHGHGSGKANFDIEISAGSNSKNNWSILLADELSNQLKKYLTFKKFSVSGDFQNIFFKATQTATMQHKEWLGLHIELPLSLRKEKKSKKLPEVGKQFVKFLAISINQTIIEGR